MIVYAAPANDGRRAPRAVIDIRNIFDDSYASDVFIIDDVGNLSDFADGTYLYEGSILVELNDGSLAATTRLGLRSYCEMWDYPTIVELI